MRPDDRYHDAVQSLYQASVDQFVTERKRLAAELKAAGDKDGAAKFAKLARPPISAWVVDQLWWRVRPAFDALFETAERLRDGSLDAMSAHREAIAKLRAEAVKILTEADHGATEATLRKVTQTLSALAAAGTWDPDLPGALSADRDPPGFEAIGISALPAEPVTKHDAAKPAHAKHEPAKHEPTHAKHEPKHDEDTKRREREAAAARAEAAAEARRVEAERARRVAERHRLEAALRTAEGDVAQRERDVARLTRELATAQEAVIQAQAVVADLGEMIARLDDVQ